MTCDIVPGLAERSEDWGYTEVSFFLQAAARLTGPHQRPWPGPAYATADA